MMFESFRVFRSRDLTEMEAEFFANYGGNYIKLPGGAGAETISSGVAFDGGRLSYYRHDGPVVLGYDPTDYMRLIYPIRGRLEIGVQGRTLGPSPLGHVVPGEGLWSLRQDVNGGESLSLRIPRATLASKLNAFLGADTPRFELRQPEDADPARMEALRRTVFGFAHEIQQVDDSFRPLLVASAMENLCLSVVANLTEEAVAVEARPVAPSAVQLGRVEEYIVAHYAEPLTLEKLAEISGVSARSVIWYFRTRYHCMPQQYLERFRLQMAQLQLRLTSLDRTVQQVALACGFPSLPAFERAYRVRFGVPPRPVRDARPSYPGRQFQRRA